MYFVDSTVSESGFDPTILLTASMPASLARTFKSAPTNPGVTLPNSADREQVEEEMH